MYEGASHIPPLAEELLTVVDYCTLHCYRRYHNEVFCVCYLDEIRARFYDLSICNFIGFMIDLDCECIVLRALLAMLVSSFQNSLGICKNSQYFGVVAPGENFVASYRCWLYMLDTWVFSRSICYR